MSLPNPNPHLLFAEERDVIGSIILVSSFVFILLNLFIIKVLHDDKHLFSCTSYKFIIILCMYDLAQLLVHLSTGILTLFRSVGHPIFMKVLGLIATPSYICYVLTTIVLAFNRFVHIAAPNVDRKLFSPVASKFWILLCFLIGAGFSVALASPYATIQYDPTDSRGSMT
ncbi:hypothetical protein L596_008725 [Steinernema carpocapsae]|uniref:G-protein coupled receptors family 1 profile domain-containing protein n=1 Tax=Steinernema carpocapsae TaxID=34508 RepID=A0A4U5PDH7_STECR|nr:hypothetical protein L596_008725 [Steinernema carpocapsae]